MSTIDEIMSEAQVFASAWSLVGGRFDDGSGLERAEERKAAMRDLIASALADARREGAEQMRDAAQAKPSGIDERGIPTVTVWQIRALPLPTGERQAVLLTDERLDALADSSCNGRRDGEVT